MLSKQEQDEFYRRLGGLVVQQTYVRLIQDPEEAERLGCRIGDVVREYVAPKIKITCLD